jgi:hypothetical protein
MIEWLDNQAKQGNAEKYYGNADCGVKKDFINTSFGAVNITGTAENST